MSQTDPFQPAHNPGEYPEDPYAGETGSRSDFGIAESVPPAVPPTGTPEPVPPTGTTQPVPPFGTTQPAPPDGTDEPVPPVGTDELVPPLGGPQSSSSSTTDVAKDEASDVRDTTKQAGQQVVHETKQQVGHVAAEAKNQTGNLLRQGVAEINSQAGQQQQRLAQGVHSIAKELGSMASSSDQSGPVTGMAQDASQRADAAAHWLETHEPGDILDGLRSFARRRPGTFLLGAAAAGVLVGRLTRGIAAEAKNEDHNQITPTHEALASGYPTATEPIPASDQLYSGPPAAPEFSRGPSTSETAWDDTLPRGLGEAGPR